MKMVAKYVLMLILAAIAGYLSSYMQMSGLRFIGANLAIGLSISIVIINVRNNHSSAPLPTKSVITIGCICGLMAGIVNELIIIQLDKHSSRGFPDIFIDIASCIAYGGALTNAYSQHSRYIVDHFYNTLMHIIKASFLILTIRIGIYLLMSLLPDKYQGVTCGFTMPQLAIIALIFMFAGAFPFSLSWFFAMTLSDPMWHDDPH